MKYKEFLKTLIVLVAMFPFLVLHILLKYIWVLFGIIGEWGEDVEICEHKIYLFSVKKADKIRKYLDKKYSR